MPTKESLTKAIKEICDARGRPFFLDFSNGVTLRGEDGVMIAGGQHNCAKAILRLARIEKAKEE